MNKYSILFSFACLILLMTSCSKTDSALHSPKKYYFFHSGLEGGAPQKHNQKQFKDGLKELYTVVLHDFNPKGEQFTRYNKYSGNTDGKILSITEQTRVFKKNGNMRVTASPDDLMIPVVFAENARKTSIEFWAYLEQYDTTIGDQELLVADEINILEEE